MSDNFTRVTTGGSPFGKDAPVVGMLFGEEEEGSLKIIDAEDIPPDSSALMKQQVELHQAVFDQHAVLGWYRVTKDDVQPTSDDVATTQALSKVYGEKIIFCFMQVTSDKESLPISLFELESDVLVGIESWKVETSEAEKIAVEKVVRELPQSKDRSAYVINVSSMQDAMGRLKERLQIMIQFLEDTAAKKIPFQPDIMRQVQQVLCQMGPLLTSTPTKAPHSDEWMSHMAVTAKTLQVVQGYTEKFRLVQEHRSAGRDHRRY
mmetsp:Transcript_7322/g.12763  ORF Transcript_7322/g.12763 Transcript_7322/m.12763 type:complete len:263 (+) Transcript_7322:70-858(+)